MRPQGDPNGAAEMPLGEPGLRRWSFRMRRGCPGRAWTLGLGRGWGWGVVLACCCLQCLLLRLGPGLLSQDVCGVLVQCQLREPTQVGGRPCLGPHRLRVRVWPSLWGHSSGQRVPGMGSPGQPLRGQGCRGRGRLRSGVGIRAVGSGNGVPRWAIPGRGPPAGGPGRSRCSAAAPGVARGSSGWS